MRRSLVVVFLLGWFASVDAQECSQLLSHGIHDIRNSEVDLQTASSFSQWFCDEKFSTAAQAEGFGASLGFPFEGVPLKLGFESNSERWTEWYARFCGRRQLDQTLQSRVREHVQSINTTLVQAFTSCINSDGLHVWLERTSDPNRFRFAARFISPNSNVPVANITKFHVGSNVECDDRPTTIDKPISRTVCTRKNDDPVSITVNSDWNPIGGTLELPAIRRPVVDLRFETITFSTFRIGDRGNGDGAEIKLTIDDGTEKDTVIGPLTITSHGFTGQTYAIGKRVRSTVGKGVWTVKIALAIGGTLNRSEEPGAGFKSINLNDVGKIIQIPVQLNDSVSTNKAVGTIQLVISYNDH